MVLSYFLWYGPYIKTDLNKNSQLKEALSKQRSVLRSTDYMEELSGSREYEDYRNAYGMPYLKLMTMTDKALNVVLDNAK